LKKTGNYKWVLTSSDFIDFEDYELAFIWGSVYCFLNLYHKDICSELLLSNIEHVACPKKYVLPYFLFCKAAFQRLTEKENAGVINVQEATINVNSPGNIIGKEIKYK
jgi:hypothetical protein